MSYKRHVFANEPIQKQANKNYDETVENGSEASKPH